MCKRIGVEKLYYKRPTQIVIFSQVQQDIKEYIFYSLFLHAMHLSSCVH